MPLTHFLHDKTLRRLPVTLINHAVLYRYSARRKLIYNRYVQISVHYDRQSSRYRSCTHDKRMRMSSLFRKLFALLDTESVLFISYYQPQPVILDLILYQCVCSNDHRHISIFYILIHKSLFLYSHGTSQQTDRYSIRLELSVKLLVMLHCQNLCWCHYNALPTTDRSGKKSHSSHNGFAGSDITLYQPVHDMIRRHILQHITNSVHLGICQCKTKFFSKTPYFFVARYNTFISIAGKIRL